MGFFKKWFGHVGVELFKCAGLVTIWNDPPSRHPMGTGEGNSWSLHLGVYPSFWVWGRADDDIEYDGIVIPNWGFGPLFLFNYY